MSNLPDYLFYAEAALAVIVVVLGVVFGARRSGPRKIKPASQIIAGILQVGVVVAVMMIALLAPPVWLIVLAVALGVGLGMLAGIRAPIAKSGDALAVKASPAIAWAVGVTISLLALCIAFVGATAASWAAVFALAATVAWLAETTGHVVRMGSAIEVSPPAEAV